MSQTTMTKAYNGSTGLFRS